MKKTAPPTTEATAAWGGRSSGADADLRQSRVVRQ